MDFLLLAGDLFHENKPSRPALYQTTAALRQWCMGDKPISFSMVSDAGMGIGRNYEFAKLLATFLGAHGCSQLPAH